MTEHAPDYLPDGERPALSRDERVKARLKVQDPEMHEYMFGEGAQGIARAGPCVAHVDVDIHGYRICGRSVSSHADNALNHAYEGATG